MTTAACFETLATCRLNRYEPNDPVECDYTVTQATQEQAQAPSSGPSASARSISRRQINQGSRP